jgi:hypothetical protein
MNSSALWSTKKLFVDVNLPKKQTLHLPAKELRKRGSQCGPVFLILVFFAHSIILTYDRVRPECQASRRGCATRIGLYHQLDGVTNLKYKLVCLLTRNEIIF